jgi:hypothetical protein
VRGEKKMKRFQQILRRGLSASLCAVLLAFAVLIPAAANAWTSSSTYYYNNWDSSYYSHSQDEAISAAEEARREVARAKRRDELEAQRKVYEKDYLASQQAIRDASRAASNAPREYYFRKPGYTTTTLPPGKIEIEADGKKYFYVTGIFYRQIDAKTFIVVPAPVGAKVGSLPEGSQSAFLDGKASTYLYYFGAFFAEKDGAYEVVQPAAGTVVGYVPDGYQQTEEGDTVRYEFGGLRFKPVILGQSVVYQVEGGG